MTQRRLLEVEEWEPIAVPARLTTREADEIERRAAIAGANGIFRWGRAHVAVDNWLGLVRTPQVELVVVPKGWRMLSDDQKRLVQTNLLVLFSRAVGVQLHSTGTAHVTANPLLEHFLFALFVENLKLALRRRVFRTYRTFSEVGIRPRGTLRFPEQFLLQWARPGVFATTYTQLSTANPLNRILGGACDVIVSRGYEGLRRAALLLRSAIRDAESPPSVSDRTRARTMQLDEASKTCLELAELILDSTGGAGFLYGSQMLGSQLVRSDQLWEKGIASLMLEATGQSNLRIQPQNEYALRSMTMPGPRRAMQLVPDVVRLAPLREAFDTKWKLMDPMKPTWDGADLEQALTYARHFLLSRVALLYPGFTIQGARTVGRFVPMTAPATSIELVMLPLATPTGLLKTAVQELVAGDKMRTARAPQVAAIV